MSIATRIESISNHLENAYNSLENIGVDLENIDKNINNLSAQIESVYDDLPKTTDTGSEVALTSTKKGKMELTLKGNMYQLTTTGKNFLDTLKETTEYKGLTITPNTDGSLNITGTSTGGIILSIVNPNNICVLPADTYTKSVKVVGTITKNGTNVMITGRNNNSTNVLGDTSMSSNNTSSTTKTLDAENTMSNIQLYVSDAGAVFNCTIYIQIEADSSATNWEPYTGEIASPNPNYPQNIQVVTGNNEIIIRNKNIAPPLTSSELNGLTFTTNENGTTHISGTATAAVNKYSPYLNRTLEAGTYVLSTNLTSSAAIAENSSQLILVGNNDTRIATINLWLSTSKTFTLSEDTFVKYYYFYCGKDFSYNADMSIQLEKSNTATTYEKYTSQSYSINLGNLVLCKTENFQDYLYENEGNWYKYGLIGKYTLDGTLNSFTAKHTSIKSDSKGFYQIPLPNKNKTASSGATNMGLSNYFLFRSGSAQNSFNNNSSGLWWEGSSSIIYCILEETSLTNANNWLKTHNTDIYYALGDPEITQITDTTLINQLNTIKNAKSYKEQTYILQNNSLPFVISASALLENSN